ncbi:sorbose reductase sou1 [Moniliophthora roreri]|uniref:Sorbose reductase sou1 n=1 Tax=Moniliophthora roreri TaxID=221103 RepID=A0A0W0EVB4_MONRR|nr:sorbose reductase sou1 [Moniliophthora roreri]
MLRTAQTILSRSNRIQTPRRLLPSINAYLIPASFSTISPYRDASKQSASPMAPLGVAAASRAMVDPSVAVKPKIFDEFRLDGRVAMVSGGNRGIGLEMALTLCEAGARAVYCLDIAEAPSEDWLACKKFVERLENGSRLEYITVDVTKQKEMWKRAEEIGDKEGRMDVCVAAAGVLKGDMDCLEYPEELFKEVIDINVNGCMFTAQAAGRQMKRFGNKGSIILIASMSGSITNRDDAWISYNSSKSAVIQMARSLACELGRDGIRVNSLSPGHIYTKLTAKFLDTDPTLLKRWSSLNPLGRLARPDEMRGVIAWLASDASSYCTGSDILVNGGQHAW